MLSSGMLSSGMLSSGMLSSGMLSSGMLSSGMLSSGMLSSGMLSSGKPLQASCLQQVCRFLTESSTRRLQQLEKQFTIQNPFGLQPSPARHIAQAAKTFPSSVSLEINGKRYDAKSLVQVLSADAKYGDIVTVSANDGMAAIAIVDTIGDLLTSVQPGAYQP